MQKFNVSVFSKLQELGIFKKKRGTQLQAASGGALKDNV